MENNDPLIVRVGTFFMVMGGGAFILFVISDLANQVDFDFLFIAMLLLGIGWTFRRKKSKPPPAGRFSGLRNMMSGGKGKKGQGAKTPQVKNEEAEEEYEE